MEEADPNNNNGGGRDPSVSEHRAKIVHLERKLLQEKDRYDLLQSESDFAKLSATQEVEKYRRECCCLRESVARLNEDCSMLREREAKDRETIKSLLEEMEAKEREFREKLVELKVEIRCLESGKRRAKDEVREWMEKYGEVEAWVLRLFDENRLLKEKGTAATKNVEGTRKVKVEEENFCPVEKGKRVESAGKIDEEMPKRKHGAVVVDADNRGERGSSESDVDEGRVPLRKKRCVEVSKGAKMDSDSSKECSVPLQQHQNSGAKGTSVKVVNTQVPLVQANVQEEVADETVQAPWRKAYIKRAYQKRNITNQTSQKSYIGRIASPKQLAHALKRAETLQCNLKSCKPSFIKPMLRSHVSSCFWLGLPRKFIKKNLPTHIVEMILEDERGMEYKAKYLGEKAGLSGGWRGFAIDHNLEIGDALVFELTEPTRFKVYIVKAILDKKGKEFDDKIAARHTNYSIKNGQRPIERKTERRICKAKRNSRRHNCK